MKGTKRMRLKKKIVYLLCELRLIKLAEKISASIVGEWRGEKLAQGFKEGFEHMCNISKTMAIAIQGLADTLKDYEYNAKSEEDGK